MPKEGSAYTRSAANAASTVDGIVARYQCWGWKAAVERTLPFSVTSEDGWIYHPSVRTSFFPAEDACATAGWHAETTLNSVKNKRLPFLIVLLRFSRFILHHDSDRRLLYFEGSANARIESPLVRSKKLPPVSTITTYCLPSLPIKVEGVT